MEYHAYSNLQDETAFFSDLDELGVIQHERLETTQPPLFKSESKSEIVKLSLDYLAQNREAIIFITDRSKAVIRSLGSWDYLEHENRKETWSVVGWVLHFMCLCIFVGTINTDIQWTGVWLYLVFAGVFVLLVAMKFNELEALAVALIVMIVCYLGWTFIEHARMVK